MTFQISQNRRDELLRIEGETNCDIGAGVDLGSDLGEYITAQMNHVDWFKLIFDSQANHASITKVADPPL